MDLATGLHLSAGVSALALGGGVVLGGPARKRNRLFGLLCGAIALWNLGMAGELTWPALRWGRLFLLGTCAAAPLGLNLAAEAAGSPPILRSISWTAYALSGMLWLSVWTPLYLVQPFWNILAIALLGGISLAALMVFYHRLRAVPPGLERHALRYLMAAAGMAVAGGLSDFVPRGGSGIPKIGPAVILVFLLVLCAVLVRRRFLDVQAVLIRVVVLLAGATVAALSIGMAVTVPADRLVPLFMVTLVALALFGPMSTFLLKSAGSLRGPTDAWIEVLVGASRRLQQLRDRSEIRQLMMEAGQAIPRDVCVGVYFRREAEREYARVFHSGSASGPSILPAANPLAKYLEMDGMPVTPYYLETESRDGVMERRLPAAEALGCVRLHRAELVVPLFRRDRLAGWIGVGGGRIERYIRHEVATALMALGNQGVASVDRIEAEDAAKRREALAAVGEMAAGLAHEVRNPLTALRGAVRFLDGAGDPDRAREMMEIIRQESDRLARVVGGFLEYARPASPRRDPVDLEMLLSRVLRSAEAAGISLVTDVHADPGLPCALGDPDQLEGGFRNLVQNAWEATGPGGALRIDLVEDGRGRILARFEDNGPGIPPEIIPRLFQPFQTTKAGGTGLGLAMLHRVIEAHGGEVRVDSRTSSGAAFTLVLPSIREVP